MRLHTLFARLCLTVSLLLGVGHAQAATITFNGATIADCPISGNQYTCASFNGSDSYTIASGYSVIVNSGVTLKWGQIFAMSGTATLTVNGNADFREIQTANLQVTGGNIIAKGGSFTLGSQTGQSMVANVTADSVTLGGVPVKLTGNIVAKDIVNLSTGSSVTGTIDGGAVTLGSNVTVMKDINATGLLTIGSGANIAGALKGNEVSVGSDVQTIKSITADGKLTVGSRTVISGPVSAASVVINSNAKIGGSLTSRGEVKLESEVNVGGYVSGTVVTASSKVTITGSVTATSSFTLASEGNLTGNVIAPVVTISSDKTKVEGNITASTSLVVGSGNQIKGNLTSPVITLKASSVVVTGDVKALNTLTIESGNSIIGNVEGGRVTLKASESFITGNALVDHITFEYHGRVQQTITCKPPSDLPCSCVTDNSRYATNDAYYPKCGPGVQSGPHHFEITHPAAALSCTPEKVTVKACADASCGSAYTNGAQVVLSPGGATAQTGNTGIVDSTVAQYAGGTATLSLTSTPATTGALVCKNSTTGNVTNCQMPFNSSGLQVSADARYAEDAQPVSISAVQASGSNPQVCVPLFANQDKTIKLKCSYANPATGTLSARIQGTNGTYVSLGASNSSACSVAGSDVLLKFNSAGVAQPNMMYADVGQLGLAATYTSTSGTDNGLSMTGSGAVIVVPAKFGFSAIASPQRAGQEVPSVTVTAQNRAGATTPNFGRETGTPVVALGHVFQAPKFGTQNGNADPEVSGTLGFTNGVGKSSGLAWAETGTIKLSATISNYLGVTKIGTVTPLATGSSADVLFIPHHFQTSLDPVSATTPAFPAPCGTQLACPDTGLEPRFVYSRQPFGLTITAQNLQNITTRNFDKLDTTLAAQQVLLQPRDARDNVDMPPAGSRLTDDSAAATTLTGVPAGAFSNGVARQMLAYRFSGAYTPSAGATTLAAPTGVLLRANYTYSAGNLVTSKPASQGTEAALTVVTGFIFVPNSSGSELLPARLDVQLKYWDGTAWRVNLADSISRFGKPQVVLANCLKQVVCNSLVVADQIYQFGGGVLTGNGRLTLQAPKLAGSVDVSVGGFSYLPSSVGRVVFGVFRSGPVLYLREMY